MELLCEWDLSAAEIEMRVKVLRTEEYNEK